MQIEVGVAGSGQHGLERIGDLLNEQPGFFPFQREDGTTTLYNRAQLVMVALAARAGEATTEPGFCRRACRRSCARTGRSSRSRPARRPSTRGA